MIRSVKSDLCRLPKLIRQTKMLDFAPAHAVSYNELVEVGADQFRDKGNNDAWIMHEDSVLLNSSCIDYHTPFEQQLH